MNACQLQLFFRAVGSWGPSISILTRIHVYSFNPSANTTPVVLRTLVACSRSSAPSQCSYLSIMSANHTRSPSVASSILIPMGSSICVSRGKSKKSGRKKSYQQQKEDESDSDEDEEEMELKSGADFKEIKVKVPSLRMDALLKAGLNMSRNKVEIAFYASKIRINGEKFQKKSHQCHEGDEIDMIRGVSRQNPSNLHVSRVVVMTVGDMDEDAEKVTVKLRRYPHLLIECYKDYTSQEEE